ncbi:MAG: hypothetical protein WC220_09545 [Pedobacter sp.]|jgi:hypothetical protein
MTFKTIFIIIVSVLVTIILMNNTEEIHFWIFGDAKIPKLAVLGVMFGLGLIVGFMAGRPRKSPPSGSSNSSEPAQNNWSDEDPGQLSDEDREYIR